MLKYNIVYKRNSLRLNDVSVWITRNSFQNGIQDVLGHCAYGVESRRRRV
jgi:hypothetical protein